MKKVEYVERSKAEALKKALIDFGYHMRTDMTSITRYLKMSRGDHMTLTSGEYNIRKRRNELDAINAMHRILAYLNENPELTALCNMNLEPDLVLEQNSGAKWGCPCDINGNPIDPEKKAPKKEYIEVNSFLEAGKHMAMYQSDERQQGILGVLRTLSNWPRADVK